MRALILMIALGTATAANASEQYQIDSVLTGSGHYAGITYLATENLQTTDRDQSFVALRCTDSTLEVRLATYMPGIFNNNAIESVASHNQKMASNEACLAEIQRLRLEANTGVSILTVDGDSTAKTVVSLVSSNSSK